MQRLAELFGCGIEAAAQILDRGVPRPHRVLCLGKTRFGNREALTQIIASCRITRRVMFRVSSR